ncbi:Two-component response regulator-like PRR73 [Apostasia shenzhenica]|uniref:Two-component response regulator-like PRR73 n=1 Tax=Apostasia shenzhenica TaxID=1088818 RepID=A0A2I0BGN2_9ASPA|nr:Two-component response regulator-like PRR73 [Apostasia shenzhenica]
MGSTHQKVSPDDGVENKGVEELNDDVRNEHKEVRDGIAGEGLGLSEEDESRINEAAVDVSEGHGVETAQVTHQPGLQKQQHQLLGPIVRWERFLPVRTLKVLLVENDDSTRQVVGALLRNCSYEVTAVATGLEAWKVLEELTNNIDLVLTEVVMPCLSGIGLLCKIMSHKTRKNVPVIMMSSNDSMGIVFKCLSKGAVDFLVKPIRKNELKNLWQHVWRRCHSSSGSGSESGIQNQKSTKSKSGDDFDDDSGSNDEEDNGSIGRLNARDGSDNGSGTQSSWTKRAVEVDSPQPLCPSDKLGGLRDSTCAQVIHSKPDMFCCSKKMQVNIGGIDFKEQNKIVDDVMSKNIEMGTLRNGDLLSGSYQIDLVATKQTMEKLPESVLYKVDISKAFHEPSSEAVDLLGGINNKTHLKPILGNPDMSKTFPKIAENKDKEGYMELPSVELSLKRLRSAGGAGILASDERNVLKRSNMSAFSRYPTSVASVPAPTGYGGSSVLDSSSDAAPLKQGSNGSSNNNDMGSTNKNVVTKPGAYKEVSTLAIKPNHPTSAFHPVQPQNSTIPQAIQEKMDNAPMAPVAVGKSGGSRKQVQVQNHHQYHHHHHHIHALQPQDREDLSLKNLKAAVAYCRSSNVFANPVETNATNYSLHGSNSCSNHGSDGQNGCNATVNAGGMNMESATSVAEKSGIEGGNETGSGSGSGAGQNRFAQREAALNKFRQKRKSRNFGKKVRYQSRKRLAEQRPRIRGQFVRRTILDINKNQGGS